MKGKGRFGRELFSANGIESLWGSAYKRPWSRHLSFGSGTCCNINYIQYLESRLPDYIIDVSSYIRLNLLQHSEL